MTLLACTLEDEDDIDDVAPPLPTTTLPLDTADDTIGTETGVDVA